MKSLYKYILWIMRMTVNMSGCLTLEGKHGSKLIQLRLGCIYSIYIIEVVKLWLFCSFSFRANA